MKFAYADPPYIGQAKQHYQCAEIVFEVMGLTPEDEFHDLYLGSGAVTRAWEHWKSMRPLAFGETHQGQTNVGKGPVQGTLGR